MWYAIGPDYDATITATSPKSFNFMVWTITIMCMHACVTDAVKVERYKVSHGYHCDTKII